MGDPSQPQKYGLFVKKKGDKATKELKKAGVFDDIDDDEFEQGLKKITSEKEHKKSQKQQEVEMAKAMAEDPSIFEYDAIYDKMQKDKSQKSQETKQMDKDRKPKYMLSLLQAAEKRKRGYEAHLERQAQKERIKEGEEFGDKEVFVTNAYRKKMEELADYEEAEKRREQIEELMDVRKQKDLSGFYKHLLNDTLSEQPDLSNVKLEPATDDLPDIGTTDQVAKSTEPPRRPQQQINNNGTLYSSDDSDSEHAVAVPERVPSPPGGLRHVRPRKSPQEQKRTRSPRDERREHREYRRRSRSPQQQKRSGSPRGDRREHRGRHKRSSSPQEQKRSRSPRGDRGEHRGRHRNSTEPDSGENRKRRKPNDSSSPPREVEPTSRPVSPKTAKLDKLRQIFARRNDEASIQAYRERYLERQAARAAGVG